MKIFNALALSILLALLVACGDESSSSAPDPIGEISSSSNDDNGSASSSSQKDSKKSSSSVAEKNSSSSVSGMNSSSSVVESSSSEFVFHICDEQTYVVAVSVEVAWNNLVANPSRDTNLQVELAGAVLLHTDSDVTVPRIVGCLFQFHLLAVHLQVRSVGHEQVNVYVVVLDSIYITRQ